MPDSYGGYVLRCPSCAAVVLQELSLTRTVAEDRMYECSACKKLHAILDVLEAQEPVAADTARVELREELRGLEQHADNLRQRIDDNQKVVGALEGLVGKMKGYLDG